MKEGTSWLNCASAVFFILEFVGKGGLLVGHKGLSANGHNDNAALPDPNLSSDKGQNSLTLD
jgi:hypothetical protein